MLEARQQGKSLLWAMMLKTNILPTGLPKINLLISRGAGYISWDAETGEVNTHKPEPITHVSSYYFYNEYSTAETGWYERFLECHK